MSRRAGTAATGPLQEILPRWNSRARSTRLGLGSRVKALLIFETIRGTPQRDQRKHNSTHNRAYAN